MNGTARPQRRLDVLDDFGDFQETDGLVEKHLPQSVNDSDGIGAAVSAQLERLRQKPMEPGLYIVATPIGNLADITLRALHVLSAADVIYCEDTRMSFRLTQHYNIGAPLRPFHEHNEDKLEQAIISEIERGKRVALISDAGTPLISDPGFKLVRACADKGLAVTGIPGACAIITAIASSGLATDQFTFAGFLPPKQAARRNRLAQLRETAGTLVFYEAPQRVAETLADMALMLPRRDGVVARELTKLHEEFERGSLEALAARFAGRDFKGEAVILAGPAAAAEVTDQDIMDKLAIAMESMRIKDAAAAVADALGVSKSRVYALGLKSRGEQ